MLKIVECDDEILSIIPNIEGYIKSYFGKKSVMIYASLDDFNNLSFIIINAGEGLYLKSDGNLLVNKFAFDGSFNLTNVANKKYGVSLDPQLALLDSNGIEHYLDLGKRDELDKDSYNGYVSYRQYNKKLDIGCEIIYQHMYNSNNKIYNYHLKNKGSIYIDKNFSKSKDYKTGKLTNNQEYFVRVEVYPGTWQYNVLALQNSGFVGFMKDGYSKMNNPEVVYSRIRYTRSDGEKVMLFPFTTNVSETNLDEMLSSYGFNSSVPDLVLNVYNGDNIIVNELKELLEQIKIIVINKDYSKCLVYKK